MRAVDELGMPIKWACGAFCNGETCYWYEAKLHTEKDEIADWLIRLPTTTAIGDLGCAFRTYATSRTLAGITNVSIGSSAA